MSFYGFIDRNILLPIAAKLQKSRLCSEYRALRQTDWLSEAELQRLQNNKLQQLVKHCYENVPYYTQLFRRLGLQPTDITCRNDLQKLPILTKQLIRDNYEDLISRDADQRRPRRESSGGSTGIPLKFMTDGATWGIKWASSFRAWHWYGSRAGERIFTFGGNSLVKSAQEKKKVTKKDIFDKYLMNNLKCDCSDMSDGAMQRIYEKLVNFRPAALRGYPAAIYNLAKYIEKSSLKTPKIKVVLTTGEMLLPQHRAVIQRVFRVPLYDSYGAGDGGIISHECYMHEGLHITEEQCVVEIVDSCGKNVPDGQSGFVVTTDLDNYVFPFLRYQVGDMAVLKREKCSCGRSSHLIGEIIGRTGKTLCNKQGKQFTSIIIDNMMFKNMDYHRAENEDLYLKIDQFQVHQDKQGDITILLKPKNSGEPMETFAYIEENFKANFPGSLIQLKYVDSIPKMSSGKDDYCISEYRQTI